MRSFLIVLCLAVAGHATAQPLADVQARMDAVFAPWDAPGTPGAAVAVVQDGRVAFADGYGYANLEYDVWFFRHVTFERDATEAVSGFRVSDGSRTEGVLFEKVP